MESRCILDTTTTDDDEENVENKYDIRGNIITVIIYCEKFSRFAKWNDI